VTVLVLVVTRGRALLLGGLVALAGRRDRPVATGGDGWRRRCPRHGGRLGRKGGLAAQHGERVPPRAARPAASRPSPGRRGAWPAPGCPARGSRRAGRGGAAAGPARRPAGWRRGSA